jgi:signal transduction histidine kinase
VNHADVTPGAEITSETLRSIREQALRIVNASLAEAEAQHPLDVPQIFDYDRPTLRGTVPIELYRAVRLLAFRETVGSKISAAILQVSGRSVARKMGVHGVPETIDALRGFGLARITIEEQTDDRLVLSAEECATCSGLPNIGEPLCYFETGFLAGGLDGALAERVRATETRCWGLGDRICQWEMGPAKPSGAEEADTLDAVMSLASHASIAMQNGLAVRLKNRELRHAYDQLRESERMKKDLTDMIVHDMRVPMNNVMGSIETLAELMDSRLTSKESRVMEMALSSGRVLVNMIDDLLDISRLEEQKQTLKKSLISTAEIAQQALEQVGIMAKRKGISLDACIAQDLPEVKADGTRISRVMVNLLSNAIQYTPSGGRIAVSATCCPETKRILVSVTDTGEGIPKEFHQRIFDKFVQVEPNRSRKRTSTGLGLAFCKLVTEAHGGTIWVESEPGLGSTFTFTLPVD